MSSEFIKLLKPQNVFKKMVRMGPNEDGGYVLPNFVLENCSAVYSYGIGRDSRFEEEFGPKFKKPAYLYDHTIRVVEPWRVEDQQREWDEINDRWKEMNCYFSPTGLGFQNNCHDFIDDYNANKTEGKVLLKIDIEGGEYDYFEQVNINQINDSVMGILLEVHEIHVKEYKERLTAILKRLGEHFILCHIHGNNWGYEYPIDGETVPQTLELTFINREFVDEYEPNEQEYPVKGLDVPNNPKNDDLKLTFLKPKLKDPKRMKISIGDVVDRYSICKLKYERAQIDNTQETYSLLNEMSFYKGLETYVDKLYEINGLCWDMESDIRSGNEDDLGLEEVGRRALKLRDLNSVRVSVKNELNSKFKEGFIEIKMDHSSETDPSLVISLTTVPGRLNHPHDLGISGVIKSLCEQADTDYEIHFNIPEKYNITGENYIIPAWLVDYKLQYPHLKVFRTEDLGPPTKLVPTLNRLKNPETILLVVDDDLTYHPDMVTEHRKYQKQFKDCCICYEGRETVTSPGYGGLRDSWILCVDRVIETKLFQHYKSASYKKKLFTQDFFDYYLGKTFSDDVLVSRYFNHRGVKILVVPYDPETPNYATTALWEANHGVETFPVLKHAHNVEVCGCNHPGLLELPTGGRFYEPPNLGNKG